MKKFCAMLLCLLLLCGMAHAETVGRVESLADGILAYKMKEVGADSVQAWLNGALADTAGMGAEWYVIALSQRGDYDFSAYQAKLRSYLAEQTVKSAVTRQKYALALRATGSVNSYVAGVMEDSIGQQGVMSWAYGLHLMNNGCTSQTVTPRQAVETLLSLQLQDGGWALNGTVSDVDVTAMVLQSLAHHRADAAVAAAAERAVTLLSQRQMEDGGFASYSTPNLESAAQVMIALCELGVDALRDDRFIKNGCTILDGMVKYALPDGTFSHTLGGASNANATVQAFCALTAYQRLLAGKGGLYTLDQPIWQMADSLSLGYKPVAAMVIALAALAACGLLLLLKKRHPKNFLAVAMIAAALVAFVFFTDFQSAQDYYSGMPVAKENPIGTVTLEIRCDTVAGRAAHIPADGVMLPETSFAIEAGDTVYTILTEAARAHNLHMESSGAQGMIYIAGIGHLYEFDFGDLSGWMMFVNGESPSVGCDQYALADGDQIQWLYSCEMGSDLK